MKRLAEQTHLADLEECLERARDALREEDVARLREMLVHSLKLVARLAALKGMR